MVQKTLSRQQKIDNMADLRKSASVTAPNIFANQLDKKKDLTAPATRVQSGLTGEKLNTDADMLASSQDRTRQIETANATGTKPQFAVNRAFEAEQEKRNNAINSQLTGYVASEQDRASLLQGGFDYSGSTLLAKGRYTQDDYNKAKEDVASLQNSLNSTRSQSSKGRLSEALDKANAVLGQMDQAINKTLLASERERVSANTSIDKSSLARTTRAFATQGGDGLTLDPEVVSNMFNKQGVDIPSEWFKVGDDGVMTMNLDEIEIDPFTRGVTRQQEDVNVANEALKEQYTKGQAAIRDQYTFKTGARAGQLTDQGKREMARLKDKNDLEQARIDRLHERGLEDYILSEQDRQSSIEAKLSEQLSPAQQKAKISAQNFMDTYNGYASKGYDSATAFALAEKDLKELGDEGLMNYRAATSFLGAEATQGLALGDQYRQLQDNYGFDGQTTFDTFKKFYGSDTLAKKAQQEYFDEQGFGETQKSIESFKTTINGLYFGKSKEPGAVNQFIEDADKANYPDSWIRGQLEVLASGIDTAPNVRDMAKSWLTESRFKTKDSSVDRDIRTIDGKIIAIDPVTLESTVVFEGNSEDDPVMVRELAKDTFAFRKDAQSQSKGFLDARDSYETLLSSRESARTDKTGASDQAMVFSFMKTLDPGSVVREGEFAQAAKNAGLGSQIVNMFDRVDKGKILTDGQRDAMLSVGEGIYNKKVENQQRIMNELRGVAEKFGYDPDLAVPNYFEPEQDRGVAGEKVFNQEVSFDLSKYPTDFLNTLPNILPNDIGVEDITEEDLNELLQTHITETPETPFGPEAPNNETKDFIKSEEGFREEAYLDSAGIPTIGYGFTTINGQPVQMGDTISQQEADNQLDQQVNNYKGWQAKINVPLTPEQEQSMTSFAYNLGDGIWDKHPYLVDLLNEGKLKEFGQEMLKFNKARDPETGELREVRGLTNRRQREAEAFNYNV